MATELLNISLNLLQGGLAWTLFDESFSITEKPPEKPPAR